MDPLEYNALVDYLGRGEFPKGYASTKSNFKKKAKKYELGGSGKLLRNGLEVVKKSEQKKIFNEFHSHQQCYN